MHLIPEYGKIVAKILRSDGYQATAHSTYPDSTRAKKFHDHGDSIIHIKTKLSTTIRFRIVAWPPGDIYNSYSDNASIWSIYIISAMIGGEMVKDIHSNIKIDIRCPGSELQIIDWIKTKIEEFKCRSA